MTEQWVTTDDEAWDPEELDNAIAARKPAVLEWLQTTDVPGYLQGAGIDAGRLRILRRFLTG